MGGCLRPTPIARSRRRCTRSREPSRISKRTGRSSQSLARQGMGRLGLSRVRRATRHGRWRVAALVVVCGLSAAALALWDPVARPVSGQASTTPTGPVHPGKAVYERHCGTCHGATGGADGPGAAALAIKPPPLTNGRLLNPLSDDFLSTVVRDGAAAVGLAPQMPAFGRLLTEREIRDVVAYVRTLAQPPYQPRPESAA